MRPIATGLGEIFMYVVEAKAGARIEHEMPYTPMDLRAVQNWIILLQLRQAPDVTEINTIGGYEKPFHVTPNPAKLLALDLSLADVVEALEASGASLGADYIEHSGEGYLIRVPGFVRDVVGMWNIILARRTG